MAPPSPTPRRPVFPPNPALVRLLGQRGPLGRGTRSKLLRCSAFWGIPFGKVRPEHAVRTPSFVKLRDMAARVGWRLPPALAAAFAEPEQNAAASGAATENREEPHAQRSGGAGPECRAGGNPDFQAEPHAQRYAASRAEPQAKRTEQAAPAPPPGRRPEIAAEPHAQRYAGTGQTSRAGRDAEAGTTDARGLQAAARSAGPSSSQCVPAAPMAIEAASPSAVRRSARSKVGKSGRTPCPAVPPSGAPVRPCPKPAASSAQRTARQPSRSSAAFSVVCVSPCFGHPPTPGLPPGSGRRSAAEPHAQRCGGPGGRADPRPTGSSLNRGRLRNGAVPGDFLAAPRCGAHTRAGHPCRQPATANGRCRLHGGLSTGPRTPEGRERIRTARTIHGAYAAPERARTQPLRRFIRRSQIFLDLMRLEAALPATARARLPTLPPALPLPPAPGRTPSLPTRRQERDAAAAEAARLAPWRLAIQAAQVRRRQGAVPPDLLAAVDEAFARLPSGPPCWLDGVAARTACISPA